MTNKKKPWITDLGVFHKQEPAFNAGEFHAPSQNKIDRLEMELKQSEAEAKKLHAALMLERLQRGDEQARNKTQWNILKGEIKRLEMRVEELEGEAKSTEDSLRILRAMVRSHNYAANLLKPSTRVKFYANYKAKRQEIHQNDAKAE